MADNVNIEQVDWHNYTATLRDIRKRVFVEEQGVAAEDEWDGQDEAAVHFLAWSGSSPVACARLQPQGKVQRMAVLRDWRKRGIGSALLRSIVRYAHDGGMPDLFLDAQTAAVPFYEKHGFVASGPEFLDAGILHRRMYHTSKAVQQSPVVRISGPDESLRALRESIRSGRNTLDILTHQLTPALYADDEVVDAILALAKRTRRSKVRVLVQDTRPLHSGRHPLVQLAQRLPSRIGLRGLQEMPQDGAMGYAINDQQSVVFFNEEAELVGYRNDSAAAEARHLLNEFDHLWDRYSFVDPNLKRLAL